LETSLAPDAGSAGLQPPRSIVQFVDEAAARTVAPALDAGAQRRIAPAALVTTMIALAIAIAFTSQLPGAVHVLLVIGACGGYVAMNAAHRRWGGLSIRLVSWAVAGYCAVAVLIPPRETGDALWYALYGRIVAVHHESPYTHVPARFPHDPLLKLTGFGWAHVPSVYGPLFTAISALASPALGTSELPTRLFYQLLATGALLTACVLVWRATRSAAAVAFLAANPVVAVWLVNGGRNDILVGVAMLGAVVLANRGHDTSAGVVGGLGALVKLTGLAGVVALVVSTGVIRGRRPAVRMAGAALGVVGAGYLVAGPAAVLTPMRTAGAAYSSASVWQVPKQLGFAMPDTHLVIALLTLPCVFVIVAYARHRGRCVTATLTTLTLGAAYMLPGYVGWAMPTAALDHRSRVSRIAAAEGIALVIAYEIVRHPIGGPIGHSVTAVARASAPFVTLAILVVLLVDAARTSRRVATERGLDGASGDRGSELTGRREITA
jgi:hypothetical protein